MKKTQIVPGSKKSKKRHFELVYEIKRNSSKKMEEPGGKLLYWDDTLIANERFNQKKPKSRPSQSVKPS